MGHGNCIWNGQTNIGHMQRDLHDIEQVRKQSIWFPRVRKITFGQQEGQIVPPPPKKILIKKKENKNKI